MSKVQDAGEAREINTAEAARRTLKLLAERRIVPTPESFGAAWAEITGTRAGGAVLALLKDQLRDLLRSGRLASQEAGAAMDAARKDDWPAVHETVARALARSPGAAGGGWPRTTLGLIKGVDALHAQWTRARKLEAVERVIDAAGDQPEVAHDRLRKLIESWGPALAAVPGAREEAAAASVAAPPPASPSVAERYGHPELEAKLAQAQAEAAAWKQVALRSCALIGQACGADTAAGRKVQAFVSDAPATAPEKLSARFIDTVAAVERQIDEEGRVRLGLQRLLGLLCDNMRSLTPE
jgi:diguanylate cyclase